MTSTPASEGDIGRIHRDRSVGPSPGCSLHQRRSSAQEEFRRAASLSTSSEHRVEFDDNRHAFRTSLSGDDQTDDEMALARPSISRQAESRSNVPLLKDERRGRQQNVPFVGGADSRAVSNASRRSSFRSKTPDYDSERATRRKYVIASFFLVLSLISFTVQTQTAVFIQQELGWDKPYCMLYMTHGSWVCLWPVQLLILRIQKRHLPWAAFWRRHVYLLRTTAQMVESQDLHLTSRESHKSPIPYIIRTTAIVTTALTVAGGSWYVAVNLTTGSDLTAIYNCSAFFAYAFSIPLLNDKLRFDKVFSVGVAIIGVIIVAYGGGHPDGIPPSETEAEKASNRTLGNLIIGAGSVLYGLYEVLYKRLACPPEGTSPGRGVIFANTFASLIGIFTLLVLWIPLPILHVFGWETFEWPQGEARWLLFISTISNATFSGSFLVLISLTSPVLSSVAALLTIFLVALVDWKWNNKELSGASITGGILIIIAFLLLSWSTYREMDEERRRRLEEEGSDAETDD
ncbi:hypothetical protein D8B26_005709 [Coccidioides posadasii str. Silveira]|nr:hypothetical protein CPC735_025050 [Coccidioides posadasii C735 delta SOWgp]EER27169.1 hypothetical protein CPC735_025050 [Coccidioides posadasii C735 delta SOWgp]KMM66902.1 hypothetical protein CPAG_03238 [Coccidioides posadasii RMSCC 3488]QVM11058.1 hypothetical protein D8B26_005709 [Coccidioides posadasii str. Silveira]|eukprot:XP_003069314.1 hypothetical protein CPC735_025050 [Coccidioides posadasii C735 delta SOWgp]